MRIVLAILASISFLSPKAQTHLPVSNLGYIQNLSYPYSSQFFTANSSDHKWTLSKYAGLTAGSIFFAGNSTSFLSVPLGLQLSRPLNKNVYALAGVSVSPVLYSSNFLFTSYPGNNFQKPYNVGFSSRVEAGLMYINDAKTFSISGRVGIERDSYPVYAPIRTNTIRK